MYLSELTIKNFRQFGDGKTPFSVEFNRGVTALVGENDAGKTAIMDAIRLVLQTRDAEYYKLQPEDFHITPQRVQKTEIEIVCRFSDLAPEDRGAFAEYLSYEGAEVVLYVQWRARRLSDSTVARRWVDISVRAGQSGTGPNLDAGARQLLATAYLRPLRDAEREMSSGRGSRLSQILYSFPDIGVGDAFKEDQPPAQLVDAQSLSLAGMSDLLRHLVNAHPGVTSAQSAINDQYLRKLAMAGEDLSSHISFAEGATEITKLRQILERLELGLLDNQSGVARGRYGLGSNNILFMACELLLLGKEPEGLPLLLIEEPEAHLHPQRQLRLMQFLDTAAKPKEQGQRAVQVILSTHSPNLSSKIPIENLVLIRNQQAFSLAQEATKLDAGDYRFLARFLDVTKANLFFAKGVMIVEGPAEAILIPTLAALLGKDLTEHGVSIVNVGSTGLGRYARILQRSDPARGLLSIPVACISDLDVMPDCAPLILGKVDGDDDKAWQSTRRKWRAKRDFGSDTQAQAQGLQALRKKLQDGDGQNVQTFVADEWTLEYDLAYAGLGKELYIAATCAANDDPLNDYRKTLEVVQQEASEAYDKLAVGTSSKEELASHVYEMFSSKRASKAIAAQYLADLLTDRQQSGKLTADQLHTLLPQYLIQAIEFATGSISQDLDGGET